MSTTTTVATKTATPAQIITMATTAALDPSCCPGCGYALPHLSLPPTTTATDAAPAEDAAAQQEQEQEQQAAKARVAELEAQVRMLSNKATAAVDRWADYEDEIARLREMNGQLRGEGASSAFHPPAQAQPAARSEGPPSGRLPSPEPPSPAGTRTSFLQSSSNRLSQLLSTRKSTPNLHADAAATATASALSSPSDPHTRSLAAALSREKSLRREAEGKLSATSREVEELSATLFEQANEMVASERRARFALEERVGELERRDKEKGRRLERLERAMSRIERVRELLEEG